MLVAASLVFATAAQAQDAIWSSAPTVAGPFMGTFNYNADANWNSGLGPVPTGTATFGARSGPKISISFLGTTMTVGRWTFEPGASSYSFTNFGSLEFNGAGIVIHDGTHHHWWHRQLLL